jgi:hypothetical protein
MTAFQFVMAILAAISFGVWHSSVAAGIFIWAVVGYLWKD